MRARCWPRCAECAALVRGHHRPSPGRPPSRSRRPDHATSCSPRRRPATLAAASWSDLGRWLASPRGAVVRPLAGATLAIGIVLVAVGPADPAPARAASPAHRSRAPRPRRRPRRRRDRRPGTDDGDAARGAERPIRRASRRPARTPMARPVDGHRTRQARRPWRRPPPNPRSADVQALPGSTADPDGGDEAAGSARHGHRPTDDTSLALTLLGIVLVGTAVLVLLLSWLARRMTRHDPLLR